MAEDDNDGRMQCAPRMGVRVFPEGMDDSPELPALEFAETGWEFRHGDADEDPAEALPRVAGACASGGPGRWVTAGRPGGRWGAAQVCRVWPGRILHVVGGSPMASRLRELLADSAAGWEPHQVRAGRTPLSVLAGPLFAVSGSVRYYNTLARSDFCTVEELAATPEDCLRQITQVGAKMAAAIRQVLRDLDWDSPGAAADAVTGRRAFIAARLAGEHQVRYREFAGMLARSPLSAAALATIAGSLSAEAAPPADPQVCQLLAAAGEADLATYYQRTHARPVT
jgi:hypothetical protein